MRMFTLLFGIFFALMSTNTLCLPIDYSNSHNESSYPRAETKKEFIARLKSSYERSKILKEANDNQPYQDVEKTLEACWKSGFIEKNPGKFTLIVLGSITAVVALTIYANS